MPDPAGRLSVSGVQAGTVTSADGTVIAVGQSGAGPAVVLVQGALNNRADPVMSGLAAGLSRRLTVFSYDRRGRGDSGDTQPYAVEREIEDLTAVLALAAGPVAVFGGSSGAGLALRAAAWHPAVTRLALWEPPYHVDATAPRLPGDFAEELDRLATAGRGGDAVELFLVRAAQLRPEDVAAMRAHPSWTGLAATARSLAYEARVMGPGNALPGELLAGITQPALVLNGGASPAWMRRAGQAVADAMPAAVRQVLEGQTHAVAPDVIVPVLLEFLVTT